MSLRRMSVLGLILAVLFAVPLGCGGQNGGVSAGDDAAGDALDDSSNDDAGSGGDDDADDDDADDDSIDCADAMDRLYNECWVELAYDGDGLTEEEAALLCELGDAFARCAAECALLSATCEDVTDCIFENCLDVADDDTAADDDTNPDDDIEDRFVVPANVELYGTRASVDLDYFDYCDFSYPVYNTELTVYSPQNERWYDLQEFENFDGLALRGSSPDDLFVVGFNAFPILDQRFCYFIWYDLPASFAHYDGISWSFFRDLRWYYPIGTVVSFWSSVVRVSATESYVAGSPMTVRYDGTTIHLELLPLSTEVLTGGCLRRSASGDEVTIVGSGASGCVSMTKVNGQWRRDVIPNCQTLVDAWCAPDGTVFAAGGDDMFRFDAGIWSPMYVPRSSNGRHRFFALGGTDSDDVYALGGSRLYHYDGNLWQSSEIPFSRGSRAASGLWVESADSVFVANRADLDGQNEVLHYDGSTWLLVSRGYGPNLLLGFVND